LVLKKYKYINVKWFPVAHSLFCTYRYGCSWTIFQLTKNMNENII